MPRKIIHRLLPDINSLLSKPSLGWIRSLAMDPNLFHINRHSVSLAFAIGAFCAFIPLPGQTLIAVMLCYCLGANLPIGMIVIWISNPVTITPMFYLTYQLGSSILDTQAAQFSAQMDWEWFKSLGADVLKPLFLGSLICGSILSIASYFAVFQLWRWKVLKNWQDRKEKRNKISKNL
jgi:uncharacterized protein (DUF2062 family)